MRVLRTRCPSRRVETTLPQVCYQTRSPWQLASTLGFVLDRGSGQNGHFLGLRPSELSALHEILQWGRVSGNNPVLKFFGQTFEEFSDACRALFSQFKHVLPKGSNRVRVRVSGKDRLKAKETDLGSTLGDESSGLVVVDYEGHPIRFNQLEIFEQIVARHKSIRFDVQAVGDGFTWRRASSSMDIDEDTLDDRMRERIAAGAQNLRADAFVKVSDAHLEAKARFISFDPLASCESPATRKFRVRDRERQCARGLSVRPPLWHRQLQLRAGHVHPAAEGLQESSTISAIFLQTVVEVLLLATGHDHKAEPLLVEPAQGSLES